MKGTSDYLRLFAGLSPFVGALSKPRAGVRKALNVFAREFQLEDHASDSVSAAIRESMRMAVMSVGILTAPLRTLADYECFLAGKARVPSPDALQDEYCGQMVWEIADALMTGALNELCAAAMAAKKEEV